MSPPLSSSRVLKLGLIQMSSTDDPDANLDKALASTREAAARGAQVICLPELFRSRYFCQTEEHRFFELAEPIPGPSHRGLHGARRRHRRRGDRERFRASCGRALPQHAPWSIEGPPVAWVAIAKCTFLTIRVIFEKFYFTPGDLGFRAFPTARGVLGVLICWDQWYPEAARLTALQGAEMLFYPTAIGWHPEEKRSTAGAARGLGASQRAHAVANGCFVVAVNRTGFEPSPGASALGEGIEFWGQSFVPGPTGPSSIAPTLPKRRARGSHRPGALEEIRTHWPFLRDRRIDAYGEITRRHLGAPY